MLDHVSRCKTNNNLLKTENKQPAHFQLFTT